MSKPVTRDRILATHAKIDAFCERLTSDDLHIIMTAARFGASVLSHATFDLVPPKIEADRSRLELNVNDVLTRKDGFDRIERFRRNTTNCHRKRAKVYAIQLAHNISGLELGVERLGDGSIQCWQPSQKNLWITDNDLELLRGDRLRLLQFWIDHVLLNSLRVFKDVGCDQDWELSSIEYVQLTSRDYDWVHFWEHKINNFYQIHLVLGDGKYYDDPEKSMYFCATNGVTPCG